MKSILKNRGCALLLFVALFASGVRAQVIDSLKSVLPNLKDTARIECLINVFVEYMHKDIYDSARYYASMVDEESKKINYLHGIAETYVMKAAMANRIDNDAVKTEQFAREALSKFAICNNKTKIEIAYSFLGHALYILGNYDEALINLAQAYEFARNANNRNYLMGSLETMTDVYRARGDYVKLLETQEKLIEYDREGDVTSAYTSHELWVMGLMYMLLEEYPNALSYWRQLFLSKPVWSFGTWNLTEYAQLLTLANQPDSALYYYNFFDSARASARDLRFFLVSKGEYYFFLKDYKTALHYFLTVFNQFHSNDYNQIKRICMDLAKTYGALHNNDSAIKYARVGLTMAQNSKSKPYIRDAYEILYSVYNRLGRRDSILYYYQSYVAMKEEVMNNQTRGKLAAYSYQNRLQLLDKERQLQQGKISEASLQRNLLVTAIIAVLLIGAVLLRSNILKRKNEANRREIAENELKLQKLESQRTNAELQQQATELEMQALRAQMNPHFIFNCLNSINRFILKNDSEAASDYLTKFSKLIRMVLNNSKQATISLEDDMQCLKLYIQMEQLRFKNNFLYTVNIDDDVDPEIVMVPPLIFQPFVENAIWHGLMNKEGGGRLTITIRRKIDQLICMVEDNGVGRNQAKESDIHKDKRPSLGLQITMERMKLFGNGNYNKTSIEVIDLKDDAGQAAGTRILVSMPVKTLEERTTA